MNMKSQNGAPAFHDVLEQQLRPLLRDHGIEKSFQVKGVKEKYLYLADPDTGLEIWIYSEGADFRIGKHRENCEVQDFDGVGAFSRYFLGKLGSALTEHRSR